MKKRIAAILCVTALVLCQVLFVLPETASAENCSGVEGEVLSVRVQYAGEREDKIREKASFTAAELSGMGSGIYRYANVTAVGTVMQIVAEGPPLLNIIEAAGVDINSVKMITFKTTDGYSRNFSVSQHLTSTRYYYPNLAKNYERDSDAQTLVPLEGSLADAQTVPSILAIKSENTKNPNRVLKVEEMDLDDSFRFCLGQTPLQEGLETIPGYDGGDVNAMDSAKYIYAMDLTLYGSPVKGISLNMDDEELKIGSEKKISVVIEGDELFADEFADVIDQLIWSSSDPEVVSVSADGTITVLKEGVAVITATAPDGTSASITIDTTGDGEEKEEIVAGKDEEETPTEPEDVTPPDSGETAEEEPEPVEPAPEQSSDTESETLEESGGSAAAENASDNNDQKDSEKADSQDNKDDKKDEEKELETVEGITVKEVSVHEVVPENVGMEDAQREEMAADAQALGEADETNPVTVLLSGYTAVLAAGFGAAFRIRRYFKEV